MHDDLPAAAAWLGKALAGDGFSVRGNGLRWGGHEIWLEATGFGTIRAHLILRGGGDLFRWRETNEDMSLAFGDLVVAQPLGYLCGAARGQASPRDLGVLASAVREYALPWFALAERPESWIHSAPPATLRAGGHTAVEWYISLDRPDLARALVERVLTEYPGDVDGFERGWQALRPGRCPLWLYLGLLRPADLVDPVRCTVWTASRLGWTAAKWLGDVARPAAAPGAVPQPLADLRVTVTGIVEGYKPYADLGGRTVVFTRQQAEEFVERLGGTPASTVTRGTALVVAGTKPGAKVEKALAQGVSIMPGPEFLRLSCAEVDRDPDRMAWTAASVLASTDGP